MRDEIPLRERRKQETRAQILRAARALILERGYEKATMRALADAAGVVLGTINLHFKDKTMLLFSAFYDEIGELAFKAFSSVAENASLRDKLLSLLHAFYEYYSENSQFWRSIIKEVVFATGDWRVKFDDQVAGMLDIVAKMIDAHKGLAEVRPDVDSRSVARVGWSIHLTALIDGLNQETLDAQRQFDMVAPQVDALLAGVLVQGK